MKAVQVAIAKLSSREQKFYLASIAIRCSLVALDLAGIFLIGAVVSLVSGTVVAPSSMMSKFLAFLVSLGFENAYAAIAGMAIAFFIFKGLLSVFVNYMTSAFLARVENRKAKQMFIQLFDEKFLSENDKSDVETANVLTTATNAAFSQTLTVFSIVVGELFLLVGISSYLFYVNSTMFFSLALFFAIISIALQRTVGRLSSKYAKLAYAGLIESQEIVSSVYSNFRAISVHKRITNFASYFSERRFAFADGNAKYSTVASLPRYFTEIAVLLGVGLIALQRASGLEGVSSATIAIFLAGTFRLVASMLPLQTGLASLKKIGEESKSALQVLESAAKKSVFVASENSSIQMGPPSIKFKNVGFSHSKTSNFVLRNISFEVPAGSFVAITGPSGAGKSTIADLILGLRKPDSGTVEVGDVEASEYVRSINTISGYVPQTSTLFRGNFLKNLTLLPSENSSSDLEELSKTLESTALMDFVKSLPQGLETLLGPGGQLLSGGQLQRLGLARALVLEPNLLVLDEATSALDATTEAIIANTLEKMRGNVTVIVIAHHDRTIKKADFIIRVANGTLTWSQNNKS